MSSYHQWGSPWTPVMIARLEELKAMGFDVYQITKVLQKEHNWPHGWEFVLEKMQDLYFAEAFRMTTKEMIELKQIPDPRNDEEEVEKRKQRKRKRELEAEGRLMGPLELGSRKREALPSSVGVDMEEFPGLWYLGLATGIVGGISQQASQSTTIARRASNRLTSWMGPEDVEAINKGHEKRRKRVMNVRELID